MARSRNGFCAGFWPTQNPNGHQPGDPTALGFSNEERYRRRYLETTGFEPPRDWRFCLVLSMFRIASILQGIAKRAEDGTAANADASDVGAKAGPIARLAWEMARSID